MSDPVAQQRVLAEVDPAALVDLASALIRIPSFCTSGSKDEPEITALTR